MINKTDVKNVRDTVIQFQRWISSFDESEKETEIVQQLTNKLFLTRQILESMMEDKNE